MKRRPNGSGSMDRERVPTSSSSNGNAPNSNNLTPHRRQYSFGSFTSPGGDTGNPSRRVSPGSDVSASASVPASLDALARPPPIGEPGSRSTSELGQYPPVHKSSHKEEGRTIKTSTHSERPSTPQKEISATKIVASNVSGPMNAAPLPTGYDFKKSDRTKKTKSFWNFSSRSGTGELTSSCNLSFLSA